MEQAKNVFENSADVRHHISVYRTSVSVMKKMFLDSPAAHQWCISKPVLLKKNTCLLDFIQFPAHFLYSIFSSSATIVYSSDQNMNACTEFGKSPPFLFKHGQYYVLQCLILSSVWWKLFKPMRHKQHSSSGEEKNSSKETRHTKFHEIEGPCDSTNV